VQSQLAAQLERSYYNYDSKDGLNASHIYNIVQDSKGYMWIGTSTGLLKFDGVTFTPIELPGLKNIEVLDLKIDDDDNLWFINLFNQLCRYSQNQEFDIIELNEKITLSKIWVKGDAVGAFRNIKKGIIFNRKTLERIEQLVNNFRIPCLNDDLYLSTDSLLNLSVIDDGKIITVESEYPYSPRFFFRFGKDFYIISNLHTQIFRLVKNDDTYISKIVTGLQSDLLLNGVSEITDSTIHLNTNKGLQIYERDFKNLKKIEFPKANVTGSLIDSENNLWVTRMNSGLIFSNYSNIQNSQFLSDFSVSNIYKDGAKMMLGTNQGNTFIKEKDQTIELKRDISEPVRFITRLKDHVLIGYNTFIDFFIDDKLIYTVDYILCNKNAVQFEENKIMISSCNGYLICMLNDDSKLNIIEKEELSRIFSIHKDDIRDEILISTLDGMYSYGISDGTLTKNILPIVNEYNIIDIEGSQSTTLWLATNNSGIIGLKNGEIKYHFTDSSLLNTNFINDIFIDSLDIIWASTTSGINIIDPTLNKSSFVTSKDGLNSDLVHKVYVDGNKVYAGTSKGLNIYSKRNNFSNINNPPIYLNHVLVDNKINRLKNLNGRENTFRFNFQGINYSSLGNFSYKYRLNGLTDLWEYVPSTINEAIYNKIPSGDYTFEAYAINEDGIESAEPVSVSFHMPKPIYYRWWVIFTSIIVAIASISWLFSRRLQQINERNELERNLQSQQLVALKAQMEPHFISNILNSIQSHSMLQDPIRVNQYITRLSKFVRNILKMSDAKVVSLKDELDVIQTYIELEQMRSDHSFEYKINVDPLINKKRFFIPPMLIQPYVENAIKHGVSSIENGKIWININKGIKNAIILHIEDNGLGIDHNIKLKQSSNHISVGTEKNSSRLDLLRAVYKKKFAVNVSDLSKEFENKRGTRVKLIITNMSTIVNA